MHALISIRITLSSLGFLHLSLSLFLSSSSSSLSLSFSPLSSLFFSLPSLFIYLFPPLSLLLLPLSFLYLYMPLWSAGVCKHQSRVRSDPVEPARDEGPIFPTWVEPRMSIVTFVDAQSNLMTDRRRAESKRVDPGWLFLTFVDTPYLSCL